MRAEISTLFLLVATCTACCQTPIPCGLSSLRYDAPLTFPAIAKAAHVHGRVVMMVTLNTDGSVVSSRVLYGPKLLLSSAQSFVAGIHANVYGGSRECPIVIEYVNGPEVQEPRSRVEAIDVQHIRITAENYIPVTMYSSTAR